jgi:hypothetical protein
MLNFTSSPIPVSNKNNAFLHKKCTNKVMQTKIAHLFVKKNIFHFRKFIEFCLIKADFFAF